MNDDETYRPGWRTIAGTIALGGVMLVAVLVLLGGQTSTILSAVGASIPSGDGGASGGGSTRVPGGDGSGGDATEPGGDEIADAAAAPPELLIIRTGSLELEVGDLPAAVDEARRQVAAAGGYIDSSEESAAGGEAGASVVYRVPADHWDATVAAIRGVATEVRHATVHTEAVTEQVVDLGARIANLRTTEAALQEIMNQATKIPEVLEVQAELTGVRGEIEQLDAHKENLENRAAYGSLAVTFRLPATPVTQEVQQGWDPATDVDRATGLLIGLGQTLTTAGIWLAIVGLPMFVAIVVVWRAVRLVSRRATGRAEST
jgi:hypothetical protein